MKIQCVNCLRVYQTRLIDIPTGKDVGYQWEVDCAILGDRQYVGLDCGKKVCRLWSKE